MTGNVVIWRTRQNVIESDATLILNIGALDGGTLETAKFAKSFGKPHLILQLDGGVRNEDVQQLLDWLQRESIGALNIAGPRESEQPGLQDRATALLDDLFAPLA